MKKTERRRPKTSISTEAPAPRRVPALAAEPTPAAKPAEDTSWKADPDLRAFACLLSYETGWMSEPAAISWSFEAANKIIEVQRPAGSESLYTAARGPLTMSAESAIAEARRRWGDARAIMVERFAFPDRDKPPAGQVLGARAQYLRQMARQTAIAVLHYPHSDPATETIAASYVDLLRTVAASIRTANTGDQSAAATLTRNVAVARVLELINPPT